MTKTIYRLKLGRGRGCAQAFGIFKWHFLIIARMQHQGRSARSLKQITAGKVSELTLRQPLKPPFKGLQGGWRQGPARRQSGVLLPQIDPASRRVHRFRTETVSAWDTGLRRRPAAPGRRSSDRWQT